MGAVAGAGGGVAGGLRQQHQRAGRGGVRPAAAGLLARRRPFDRAYRRPALLLRPLPRQREYPRGAQIPPARGRIRRQPGRAGTGARTGRRLERRRQAGRAGGRGGRRRHLRIRRILDLYRPAAPGRALGRRHGLRPRIRPAQQRAARGRLYRGHGAVRPRRRRRQAARQLDSRARLSRRSQDRPDDRGRADDPGGDRGRSGRARQARLDDPPPLRRQFPALDGHDRSAGAPDAPDIFGADLFCQSCQVCTRACPPDAIAPDKQTVRGTEKWYVDFDKCLPYFVENETCGICLAVCPWSRPGVADNLVGKMARRLPQTGENR